MTNDSIRPIVVGADGSEIGATALRWAAAEAARHGRPLKVFTITPQPRLAYTVPETQEWAKDAEEQTTAVAAHHPDVHIRHLTVTGMPGHALVEAAEDAEMLVVGSRGAGMMARALLGSVSAYCANHARCPVVIVPATWRPADPAAAVTDGALTAMGPQ